MQTISMGLLACVGMFLAIQSDELKIVKRFMCCLRDLVLSVLVDWKFMLVGCLIFR
jgi:hypothetical protein